jgi:hypothetical protein
MVITQTGNYSGTATILRLGTEKLRRMNVSSDPG